MPSSSSTKLSTVLPESECELLLKSELQEYLRLRGKPVSGSKSELLQRVLLFRDAPVHDHGNHDSPDDVHDIFSSVSHQWRDVTSTLSSEIPSQFSITIITDFLSSFLASNASIYRDDSEDEEDIAVDIGTKKPVVKGRLMYLSEKVHLAQFTKSGTNLLFRAHVEASMKKSLTRYPQLALDTAGRILDAKCTCVQSADKRCCHIAVFLYLVEDLSFGIKPRIWESAACVGIAASF